MSFFLSFSRAFFPPLIFLCLIFFATRKEESLSFSIAGYHFAFGVVAGILAIIIAVLMLYPVQKMEEGSPNFWAFLAWETIFILPLLEELLKALMLFLVRAMSRQKFSRRQTILYALMLGIGVGLAENVMYFTSFSDSGWARSFSAVPLHAMSAGVLGLYLGKRKAHSAFMGLFIATSFHSLYNIFTEILGDLSFPAMATLIVLGALLFWFYRKAGSKTTKNEGYSSFS